MHGKKGLSTVIAAVMLVLIGIVAVVISWAFISGIIQGTGDQITENLDCLDTKLEILSASRTRDAIPVVDVTVKRGVGPEISKLRILIDGNPPKVPLAPIDVSSGGPKPLEELSKISINSIEPNGFLTDDSVIVIAPTIVASDGGEVECVKSAVEAEIK